MDLLVISVEISVEVEVVAVVGVGLQDLRDATARASWLYRFSLAEPDMRSRPGALVGARHWRRRPRPLTC